MKYIKTKKIFSFIFNKNTYLILFILAGVYGIQRQLKNEKEIRHRRSKIYYINDNELRTIRNVTNQNDRIMIISKTRPVSLSLWIQLKYNFAPLKVVRKKKNATLMLVLNKPENVDINWKKIFSNNSFSLYRIKDDNI